MNTDPQILNEILESQIQYYMKMTVHHNKWDLYWKFNVGSTYENQIL